MDLRDGRRSFVTAQTRRDRTQFLASSIGVAFVFTCLVAIEGVPAVRHDWFWNADVRTFYSNVWSSWGGWYAYGIGSPRAYPTDYLTSVLISLLVRIVGPTFAYVATMFAIGFACAAGGIRLALRFCRTSWSVCLAVAMFAILNPWVYNKVVAGHIFMVLAYAATMLVVSELAAEKPSIARIVIFSLLALQQLQFFVPIFIAVFLWSVLRRSFVAPAVLLLSALPIVIGVVGNWSYLHTIPYTAAWQTDASVAPAAALGLSGYFARYSEALGWFTVDAMWVVALLAATGVIFVSTKHRTIAIALAVGSCVLWLFASGTKGFAGPAYLWIAENVSASGLYRELYDLIGFLAIAYLVGAALAVDRFAQARWVLLAAGLLLSGAWIGAPPSKFWVASSRIPPLNIGSPPNTRFALLPALQPMSFLGNGSGLDPGAVVRPGNIVPLNSPQFSFPETPALMRYAVAGDTRWLAALSVSQAVVLPYFRSDIPTLRYQEALPLPKARALPRSQILPYLPELTLASLPSVDALPAPPWENRIFFGDAALAGGEGVPQDWHSLPKVIPVVPPSRAVAASDGWVDVRSAFVSMPSLAQGLGGAVTTNHDAVLPIDPAQQALVYVRGRLEDAAGRLLSATTPGYTWIDVHGARALRCSGLCVVAAQAPNPMRLASAPQPGCAATIGLSQPASWLAVANLSPGPTCLLRYNVRFDEHWIAFRGTRRLAHVAIDSTFNGWIVPGHTRAYRLVIVETVAALQFLAQVLAIVALIVIFARFLR